jgi:hypothetical protein
MLCDYQSKRLANRSRQEDIGVLEQSPRIDDVSQPDDVVAMAKFLTEDPKIREHIAVACHQETEGDMSRGPARHMPRPVSEGS